jgi:hypothetical protein
MRLFEEKAFTTLSSIRRFLVASLFPGLAFAVLNDEPPNADPYELPAYDPYEFMVAPIDIDEEEEPGKALN